MITKPIYMDNAATTPVHPDVIKTITDTLLIYGNPSSSHSLGIQANNILREARITISNSIGCTPEEIIFTSGACEANSLAIQGYLDRLSNSIFITTAIEHKSIRSLCVRNGYNVRFVKLDKTGRVDLDCLEQMCKIAYLSGYGYLLVSIQAANNEFGTIQDIKAISDIVHKYNGVFHTDATQLYPHQQINVKDLGIDMMSISGQKINAPKGIGFLYVANGITLKPIIYGSQMEGRRGGTENIPYIAGLAKATELLTYENAYVDSMRSYMIGELRKKNLDFIINGHEKYRIPNSLSVSFKKINGLTLASLLNEDDIYLSTTSACDSTNNVSPVLSAIQIPNDYIEGTLRITLSNDNTFDEIDKVVDRIATYVDMLKD